MDPILTEAAMDHTAQETALKTSFLNPMLLDGARGAVRVAKRRIGVFLAALAAGAEGHPLMSDEHLCDTVRDELCELDAIRGTIERKLEEDETPRRASGEEARLGTGDHARG